MQIHCTLQNVNSFLGVFPSDLLTHSITRSGSIIVNTDPHTQKCLHWLAINFEPKPSSALISTLTVSPQLFRPSKLSYVAIAPSGTTTRYNCRVWPAQSAANIAAYSPCTWTEGTPQNNSSALLLIMPTGRLTESSHLYSHLYAKNCAVDNAETCIKGTTLLINLSLFYCRSKWRWSLITSIWQGQREKSS